MYSRLFFRLFPFVILLCFGAALWQTYGKVISSVGKMFRKTSTVLKLDESDIQKVENVDNSKLPLKFSSILQDEPVEQCEPYVSSNADRVFVRNKRSGGHRRSTVRRSSTLMEPFEFAPASFQRSWTPNWDKSCLRSKLERSSGFKIRRR